VKHHLGSSALFGEALLRAMVVGTLIILGALFAALPTHCASHAVLAQRGIRA